MDDTHTTVRVPREARDRLAVQARALKQSLSEYLATLSYADAGDAVRFLQRRVDAEVTNGAEKTS